MVTAAVLDPRAQQAAAVVDSLMEGKPRDALDQLRLIYKPDSSIPGKHGEYLSNLSAVVQEGDTTGGKLSPLKNLVGRGLRRLRLDIGSEIGQKLENLQVSTGSLLSEVGSENKSGIVQSSEAVALISAHVLAITDLFKSHDSLEIKVGAAEALGKIVQEIKKSTLDFSDVTRGIQGSFASQLRYAANSIGDTESANSKALDDNQRTSLRTVESTLLELALELIQKEQ